MLHVRERETDRDPEQAVQTRVAGAVFSQDSSEKCSPHNQHTHTHTHTHSHSNTLPLFWPPFALMEPQYRTPQPMGKPAWEEVGPSTVDCKKAGHC